MKRIATLTQKGVVVGFVHGHDYCDQSVKIAGKIWRFDYDLYGGPLWLRKDGESRKCQNPNRKVWQGFEKWYDRTITSKKERTCF